jgi:hypothetical protein
MSNIKKYAVNPTARLPLVDASENPLFADGPDGKPDKSKPMAVNLYGPGSKEYAAAQAKKSNALMDRLRRKGKVEQSPEQIAADNAEFLADITQSFENVTYDDKQGRALAVAVYSDQSIGFIADQVAKHVGDWANFSKPSPAN